MIDYQKDVIAWANEQAQLLRAGKFSELDVSNVAEEIEDVAKAEQREFGCRFAKLLMYRLIGAYGRDLEYYCLEFRIDGQRSAVFRHLRRAPSLKSCLTDADWFEDAYLDACNLAASEKNIDFDHFPEKCEWTVEQILK